jgi:porin
MGLDRGAILIGEAGVRGAAHVAVGAWTYTEKQDDIRDVTSTGEPVQRQARGAYALAERELWAGASGTKAAAFARIGVSDGRTTPFRAGWQAGLRFDGITPSRPKSAASIGLQQAFVSNRARESARESGGDMAPSESGVEITYADSFGRLSVQPDLQLIRHPGGRPDDKPAVVAGVRFTIDLS